MELNQAMYKAMQCSTGSGQDTTADRGDVAGVANLYY